jgi:hypothetical protein
MTAVAVRVQAKRVGSVPDGAGVLGISLLPLCDKGSGVR